jgi:hypothetical protein
MKAILQRMVETDEVLLKMLKEWLNKLKAQMTKAMMEHCMTSTPKTSTVSSI